MWRILFKSKTGYLVMLTGLIGFIGYIHFFHIHQSKLVISSGNLHVAKDFPTTESNTVTLTKWSSQWPRVHLFNCSQREFMNKGANSLNATKILRFLRTGIVSAPGSGNTWTRFLIEQGTGLWTGSVFGDKDLYRGGFKGEIEKCKTNSTMIIKAHHSGQDERSNCSFERIILIVRDLHRALLSEFNRQYAKSHVAVANETLLGSEVWRDFVMKQTYGLALININWISRFMKNEKKLGKDENPFILPANHWKSILLVSYERMKLQPTKEMERIVEFLGLPVFRKECINKNSKGEFQRRNGMSKEAVACLYEQPHLSLKMNQTIRYLKNSSIKFGTGNILAHFEGIGNIDTKGKCKEWKQ